MRMARGPSHLNARCCRQQSHGLRQVRCLQCARLDKPGRRRLRRAAPPGAPAAGRVAKASLCGMLAGVRHLASFWQHCRTSCLLGTHDAAKTVQSHCKRPPANLNVIQDFSNKAPFTAALGAAGSTAVTRQFLTINLPVLRIGC